MSKLKSVLILLAFSVLAVACSNNKGSQAAAEANPAVQVQGSTGSAADKLPDPTTPELEVISVFVPRKDSTGIVKELDAIDSLDADLLLDKLVEYGVLPEDTQVKEFDNDTEVGNLVLNKLDTSDKKTIVALVNTFIENFELKAINIKGSDSEALNGLEFNKEYKNIQ